MKINQMGECKIMNKINYPKEFQEAVLAADYSNAEELKKGLEEGNLSVLKQLNETALLADFSGEAGELYRRCRDIVLPQLEFTP
jgi:hypothetical protein